MISEEIHYRFERVDHPRTCSWKAIGGDRCKQKAHHKPCVNGKGQQLIGVYRYFCEEHVVYYYRELVSSYKKKLFPETVASK